MADSFGALGQIDAGGRSLAIARLDALAGETDVARLPYTLRVLLENVLRSEALGHGSPDEVRAVAGWDAQAEPKDEISFRPARVLLQDFTGVPAIVDLAAMREAMVDLGGDAATINPQIPAELVIDHSVQVDEFGSRMAMFKNTEREFQRNRERYAFLRWGQTAFDNFSVVPPNTGIVHQVNLEYLARVVEARDEGGRPFAFPDTLIGTDSHTTMINGLGVLGWGVGGIEAEAVLLGEPVSMLVPRVVGFRLTGELPEGATATDLVLSVTQILRAAGVVGQVRRVLRPRAGRAPACRPRDHREHVAGVRRDVRVLPGRRGDAPLHAAHGPERGAGRAGGGVLPRAGPLPRPRPHARVLAGDRARPRRRRAEPRRAAAPAGPSAADRGEVVLPRVALELRRPVPQRLAGQGDRRHVPSERPGIDRGAGARVARARRRRRSIPSRLPSRSPSPSRAPSPSPWATRRSTSSTAPSSSRRSRAARTRRTRR